MFSKLKEIFKILIEISEEIFFYLIFFLDIINLDFTLDFGAFGFSLNMKILSRGKIISEMCERPIREDWRCFHSYAPSVREKRTMVSRARRRVSSRCTFRTVEHLFLSCR